MRTRLVGYLTPWLLRRYVSVLASIFITSCATTEIPVSTVTTTNDEIHLTTLVPGQINAPIYLQSIRLAPSLHPDALPIINLGSNETLLLEFDELSNQPSTFIIEIEHNDPNWRKSALLPRDFLRFNYTDRITQAAISVSQRPGYFHYRYAFPSPNFDVLLSGNYLMNIKEASTGKTLFNLPFLVTESMGTIKTTVSEMPRAVHPTLSSDQVEVDFDFPDTLTRFPSTDFQTRILQDHFWGNIKTPDQVDISKQGHIRYHLGRNQLFIRPYEIRILQLDLYTLNYYRYQPELDPPLVLLSKETIDESALITSEPLMAYGRPRSDRSARYFKVQFNVDLPAKYSRDSVVVIGSFNQWKPHTTSLLTYDETLGSYTASALVKEGQWQYKYAILKNKQLDDLSLDHPFSRTRRTYTTFIYYKAFGTSYYRLINTISSRSSP